MNCFTWCLTLWNALEGRPTSQWLDCWIASGTGIDHAEPKRLVDFDTTYANAKLALGRRDAI
jgi:hypothetical protein